MISRLKFFLGVCLGALATVAVAQQQPVVSVSVTGISLLSSAGTQVSFVSIVNGGSGYTSPPVITTLGGSPSRMATFTSTVSATGALTSISVIDGGAGYSSAPTLVIAPPPAATPPAISTQATATAYLGTPFNDPLQNESFGPYGTPIAITALAVGTFPAGGFTYEFFVNGISIGVASSHPPAGVPASIGWTPPQPGSYFITVKTTDGANSATSLAVRYFATGTEIVSPVDHTLVPRGSSVVIQATAAGAPRSGGSSANAFIDHIAFYADGSATPFDRDYTYPYSTIYTPPSTPQTHVVEARAFYNPSEADQIDPNGTATKSLHVVDPVGSAPTCVISSPTHLSAVAIPTNGSDIAIAVDAHSNTGLITKVELYIDGVLFGTKTSYPYTFSWHPTVVSTYKLLALTYDDKNNVVASSTNTNVGAAAVGFFSPSTGGVGAVSVTNTGAGYTSTPAVTISPPASTATGIATINAATGKVVSIAVTAGGAGYTSAPAVTISQPGAGGSTASAVAVIDTTTGRVVGVTITDGGTFYTTSPVITFAAPATSGVTASAVATMSGGKITGVTITNPGSGYVAPPLVSIDPPPATIVTGPTIVTIASPPTVTVTYPTSGATVTGGSSIQITANATDNSPISSVQFFETGTFIGSATVPASGSTYAVSYVPTPKFDSNGQAIPLIITALATNSLGLSALSTGVSLNVTTGGTAPPPPVKGTAPTVAITAPLPSSVFSVGAPLTLSASAVDQDGTVTSVQFLVDDQPVATDTVYPYNATWTPTNLGTYKITAVATDNDSNKVTSSVISVSVVDPSPSAPNVTITSPVTGSSVIVGSSMILFANATDDVAVASVQFFLNGQPLGGAISQFPFKTSWVPTSAGAFTFVALATDNIGNQTTSAPVTVIVTGGNAPVISITSPSSGTSIPLGNGVQITTTATDSDGSITSVQFFANGVPLPNGTLSSPPFNLNWVPTSAGTYAITAVATDNAGNSTTAGPVSLGVTASSAPNIAITNPTANSTFGIGTPIPVTAGITAATGTSITQVQFFVNGISIGTDSNAPYAVNWTPTATGTYTLTAIATNNAAITTTSIPVTVTISGNSPPVVALTSPSPGTTVSAGNVVSLAATAGDVDGTITSVRFLANGNVVGTVSSSPFLTSWTPTAAGSYSIVAQAFDSSGNVTLSPAVTVTVTANLDPIVSLTTPRTGTAVIVGTATTVTASAADPDGTIASVQFYANGNSLGTDTIAPYSATWTPTAEGTYRLSAVAIDNSGSAVTSATVMVVAAVTGSGSVDVVATGLYINPDDATSGEFSLINLHGQSVTFIGYVPAAQTSTPAKIYYFADAPLDSSGYFELTNNAGAVIFSGQLSASGVSGSFAEGSSSVTFGGTNTAQKANAAPSGYFSGSITGHPGSLLTGFVGLDGRITVYAKDGAFADAGAAAVNATTGGFSITTRSGNRIVGVADPITGLLTGTITKSGVPGSDSFTGAQASGSTFSDGSLRNISSRGWVGTGDKALIAGFVVTGSSPKQILIRAVGPTLGGFGVTGALANPALYLFNHSGTPIASNDNWGTGGVAVSNAASLVGAQPLPVGSLDASILTTLAPGVYSTQVSGVANTTGIALVELYDVDAVPAFSAEKMVNISTRGFVGGGDNILIAGFVVNGTSPKKILVRGVGPTLATVGLSNGILADPVLRIVRANGPLIRENDDWGTGNDVGLVSDAAAKIGAFPLTLGSKDAAILMNLPPGVYSAQLSGAGSSTGIGMIEVYEVQ